MKNKSLLIMLLMLIGYSSANAKIFSVGNTSTENATSSSVPYCTNWKYCVTQQIYTVADVGYSGTVNSIGFYLTEDYYSDTRNMDIYMVQTDKTQFTGSKDWVSFTASDLVFSGEVTFLPGEWTTINLTTPFTISSSKNFAIIVDDNTGSYYDGAYFVGYTSTEQAITSMSDDDNYDISQMSTYSGSRGSSKNWLQINGQYEYCPQTYVESSVLPTSTEYRYSLSQQIYTASEIGADGKIKSISYYNFGAEQTRNIDLYMTQTGATTFSSSWLPCTASDKVFSGEVTFASEEWTTITLDTPFEYYSTGNLVVTLDDNTKNGATPANSFLVYDAAGQARYAFHDGRNYDPTGSVTDGENLNVKNTIKLDMTNPISGVIGDGYDDTNYLIPTNTNYNYTLSQQIYTAEELGEAKDLTSISFYNTTNDITRKIDIYLVHTDKTEFAGWDDAVVVTDADKVFSGEVTFTKDVWTAIPFGRAFHYNGTDNVILVVDDNTGTYTSSRYFLAFDASKQTLQIQSDGTNFNPKEKNSLNSFDYKNQIKINQVGIENMPTNLQVLDISENSVMLSWEDHAMANAWELEVNDKTVVAYTNPYTVLGLEPNTEYQVRVRAIMGEDEYSDWSYSDYFRTATPNPEPTHIEVATTLNSATIKWIGSGDSYKVQYRKDESAAATFFTDFSSGLDAWTIYTLGGAPDDDGWYTTGTDCAISTSYYSPISRSYNANNWLVSPQLDLLGMLKFVARSTDTSGNGYEAFEVLLSTTGNAISDFTTVLRPLSESTYGWDEYAFDLSAYTGQQGYIAIHHVDNGKGDLCVTNFGIYDEVWNTISTTQQTATISGLESNTEYLYKITSVKAGAEDATTEPESFYTKASSSAPSDIAIVPNETSAKITWTGVSDMYTVYYRESSVVSESPVFFDDFETNASTNYSDGHVDWNVWSSRTNGETIPDKYGWYLYKSGDDAVNAYSGSYAACASSYYRDGSEGHALNADNWLYRKTAFNLGGRVKFWARSRYSSPDEEPFEVRLSIGSLSTSTSSTIVVRPMETVPTTWTEVDIDLRDYVGQQGWILIHHEANNKGSLYIDDFAVYDGAPGSWQQVPAFTTEATLTGLKENTKYDIYVVGYGSAGEVESSTYTFKTGTPASFVLDNDCDDDANSSIIYSNNGQVANVTINNMTLKKDGEWQTIGLPFDVDVANSPLAGADVRTLEGARMVGSTVIVDCLTPVTKMKACTPYIIKWNSGSNIVNPTFNGVVIVSADNSFGFYDFITFETAWWNTWTDESNCYYIGENYPELSPFTDGRYFKAFESCFIARNTGTKSVILNTGEYSNDFITGITSLENGAESEIIYNVAGQRLDKKQKGINIVNGKKVLVK